MNILQTVIFSVKVHPLYTSFKNCVSIGYFTTQQEEVLYNVFSIVVMYFAPLVVIIVTYSLILRTITKKSKEHQEVRKNLKLLNTIWIQSDKGCSEVVRVRFF